MARALLFAAAMLPGGVYPFFARVAHDTGNRGPVSSDSLVFRSASGPVSYAVFARRDEIPADRNLLNAAALAYAVFPFEGHEFAFGLGAHYRQSTLWKQKPGTGSFHPALGATWSHELFRADLTASEYLTRTSISLLTFTVLPVEFNTEFEYLFSQPYRWSANAYFFLTRRVGLVAGYEPLAERLRSGFWLKPSADLQLAALARVAPGSETFVEFSLSFSLDVPVPASARMAETQESAAPARQRTYHKQRRLPQRVPAFAVLVKWGLSPVEALRFSKEKDACTLNEHSKQILAGKRWGCREGA